MNANEKLLAGLSPELLTRLANLPQEKLQKVLDRAERGERNRFQALRYNHYRDHRLAWEREAMLKLLEEKAIPMPEYPHQEEDFTEKVANMLRKKAENGDQKALATLQEANLA